MKTSKRSFSDQTTTISTASVAIASSSEEALVVDALVRAFVSDPVVRWTWPNLRAYITHFPNFIKAFGGRAFSQGSAYCTDGYAGAALWLPPGIHPDEEALNNIFQQTVSEQQQPDLFAMFEEMDHYHPDEPHWYLPLIGVVPTRQSQGCGAALMHQALLQWAYSGMWARSRKSSSPVTFTKASWRVHWPARRALTSVPRSTMPHSSVSVSS